jgi:hypothetical protein
MRQWAIHQVLLLRIIKDRCEYIKGNIKPPNRIYRIEMNGGQPGTRNHGVSEDPPNRRLKTFSSQGVRRVAFGSGAVAAANLLI